MQPSEVEIRMALLGASLERLRIMALQEYEVYLMGGHSPLSYRVHQGSFGGYKATGVATVRAVSIKQAYYFCHVGKIAKGDMHAGITQMNFWDELEINTEVYTLEDLWKVKRNG